MNMKKTLCIPFNLCKKTSCNHFSFLLLRAQAKHKEFVFNNLNTNQSKIFLLYLKREPLIKKFFF